MQVPIVFSLFVAFRLYLNNGSPEPPASTWRIALTWQSEKGRRSGRPSRPRVIGRLYHRPHLAFRAYFYARLRFLVVVPITNRRLFVYCVRILSEQRLLRAAGIVHFAFIIERSICHAVWLSVLFHRAIFCISRIFLCAHCPYW